MEFVQIGICVPHPCLVFAGIKDSLPGTDKFKGRGGINFFTQEKIAMIRLTLREITYRPGSRRYANRMSQNGFGQKLKGHQPWSGLYRGDSTCQIRI